MWKLPDWGQERVLAKAAGQNKNTNDIYKREDSRQNSENCTAFWCGYCCSSWTFHLISNKHYRASRKLQSFHCLHSAISSSPSPSPLTAFPWIYFLQYELPLCVSTSDIKLQWAAVRMSDHDHDLQRSPPGAMSAQIAADISGTASGVRARGLSRPLQCVLSKHDQVSGIHFDDIFFFSKALLWIKGSCSWKCLIRLCWHIFNQLYYLYYFWAHSKAPASLHPTI